MNIVTVSQCVSVIASCVGLFSAQCNASPVSSVSLTASKMHASSAVESYRDELSGYRFDFITPTGQRIFQSALNWMENQAYETDDYAQPGKCAYNVSRVLEDAGLYRYSADGLVEMVERARARGGRVVPLPHNKYAMIATLNSINGGRLPVGTMISGCKNPDCSGQTGDGHIALVGDIDADGNTQLYHNNWFRPDSLGPDGEWQPHMVSQHWYYDLGLLRQWMPTPWMKFYREPSGRIVDVESLMPEIDDLDPFNYYITVTIVPEILREAPEAGQ